MKFGKYLLSSFVLTTLFGLFFTPAAFASDLVTYTAPNTLVFDKDTTTCQAGSAYSVQLWSPSIGSTLIFSQSQPSFPVTIDLSTVGLTNGNTYLASEFCSWGAGSNRDNTTFTYESSSPTTEPAPVTTIGLTTQNSDGSYSDPATVTLSATAAAGFTIANTYYVLDNDGVQRTYSGPFTVSGARTHTIVYWSVDNNGVQENGNRQTFTISDIFNISNIVFNTDTNQMDMDYTGDTTLNGQRFAFVEIFNQTTFKRVVEYENNYGCDDTHCTFTDPAFTDLTNIIPGDSYTVRFELLNPNSYVFPVNPTFTTSAPTLATAINAGGNTSGNFVQDTDFTGGSTFTSNATVDTSNVQNPAPQDVYQSVRYGNFSYTIPNLTANGTYTVQLHFNELYWGSQLAGSGGVGSRVFNVGINGTQVLNNFDIFATAGGANKALVEQFPATADANGNITVQFSSVVDNAMVNGIAVYNETLPPLPTPTPVSSLDISAGGQGSGNFIADTDFSGGGSYTSSADVDTSGVTNPAPESVYQNSRYGNFTYFVPTFNPNANYQVRLHFNELYWGTPLAASGTGAGSRVFNVAINGTQVLNNFDIFATAGGANKAIVEQFNTTSDSNGFITIQFNSVVDNAIISGIEVNQQ